MTLKRLLMLAVILITLVPFCWEPAQSTVYNLDIEDRLYRLVELSGARPVELNVQGWARVNEKFVTIGELERIAGRTAGRLGDNDPQLITENDGDFRQVRIQSLLDDRTVLNVAAQSLINYSQPRRRGETYLTVSIARKIDRDDGSRWADRLRSALAAAGGGEPQVLTNIIAAVPGKLSGEEKRDMARRLFEAAGAEKVEGIDADGLFSLTGYTPKFKDSLRIGENKVNINIAVRYHSSDGQTYIYIGAPILTGEY